MERNRKGETIMATLGPWNPYQDIEEVNNRLAALVNRAFGRSTDGGDTRITVSQWVPLVDIVESEKEYLIQAELPQLKREEVKVTVERGMLSISGERKFEKKEEKTRVHRVERSYGSFVRTFTVPEDADATKVTAEFRDGLLSVRLPKSENAQPRQIDVQIS
jgi:HSP20 family protein